MIKLRITKMDVALNGDCSVRLVKEYARNYTGTEDKRTSKSVVQVMNEVFEMDKKAEEYLYMISLTNKCRPIGFFEVSHGTHDKALVGEREIFMRALLSGATSFILVHNHPSGEVEPSLQDRRMTKTVMDASRLMGIRFCDHIIIGRDSYYSFCENGGMG